MTETHATVRAVFRMWTGASNDQMTGLFRPSHDGLSACALGHLNLLKGSRHVADMDVTDDGALLRLPSCPACGVLLTMAEENRRTE